MSNPIVLPCLDSFCLECLMIHCSPTELPNCPACGTASLIPTTNLQNLPFNRFVMKVIELQRIANECLEDEFCEVCSSEKSSACGKAQNVPAVKYCRDCAQKFCTSCLKYHEAIRSTRKHKVVDLGSESSNTMRLEEAVWFPVY